MPIGSVDDCTVGGHGVAVAATSNNGPPRARGPLSASTVRSHLHNVYRKLGAIDRAQAVLIARDRGWI